MGRARIHITGGSGSGTTTLGRALASRMSVPGFDTDDFYWFPSDPPFRTKREVPERLALMEQMFLPRRSWVLSGSLVGWGDTLTGRFDLVVFLTLDPKIRMDRLIRREARRYDAAQIAPDGPLHAAHATFMQWAARYDDPHFAGRSRTTHERWLEDLACPVLRLDSARPVVEMVDQITTATQALPSGT